MLLSLLLSGCAIDGYYWTKERDVPVAHIRKVEDTSRCPVWAEACSEWHGADCTIYVPKDSPALVGHEAVHCLGWNHADH